MLSFFSFPAILRCFGSGSSSCQEERASKQWKLEDSEVTASHSSSLTSSSASRADCPSLCDETGDRSGIEKLNSHGCVEVDVAYVSSSDYDSSECASTSSDDDAAASASPDHSVASRSGARPAASPAVAPLPAAAAHPQLPAALLLRLAAMEKRFGQQLGTYIIYEEEDGVEERHAAEGDSSRSHGGAAVAAPSGAGHASDCDALLAASLAAVCAAAGLEEGGVSQGA